MGTVATSVCHTRAGRLVVTVKRVTETSCVVNYYCYKNIKSHILEKNYSGICLVFCSFVVLFVFVVSCLLLVFFFFLLDFLLFFWGCFFWGEWDWGRGCIYKRVLI